MKPMNLPASDLPFSRCKINMNDYMLQEQVNMTKKPRLEWLDALRGFTMILVVAYHVAEMGFGESWRHSSSMPFLVLFRMPLFFFVSGFLAYRASQVWNLSNLGSLLWKKIKVQTIPTVVFFFFAILSISSMKTMPCSARSTSLSALAKSFESTLSTSSPI